MKLLTTSLCILTLFAFNPTYGQSPSPDEIIKVETALVSVPVIVSDRHGRYISNLGANDFSIYQDGKKQEISFFANKEEPLNIALLLDTSLSTTDVIDKIKRSAIDFISLLKPRDKAAVITFDSEAIVIQPLTANRIKLEQAIRNVDIGYDAGTVMRDAVLKASERTLKTVKGRKAIIILTDGKDFGSYESPNDLLNTLKESDVLVYSVFYKTEMPGFRQRRRRFGRRFPQRNRRRERMRSRQKKMNKEAAKYLKAMSQITAGRFFSKKVSGLKKTFRLITSELRNQYRLGYYPKNISTTGTTHKIKVRVARKRISVRSRTTYRAK